MIVIAFQIGQLASIVHVGSALVVVIIILSVTGNYIDLVKVVSPCCAAITLEASSRKA